MSASTKSALWLLFIFVYASRDLLRKRKPQRREFMGNVKSDRKISFTGDKTKAVNCFKIFRKPQIQYILENTDSIE